MRKLTGTACVELHTVSSPSFAYLHLTILCEKFTSISCPNAAGLPRYSPKVLQVGIIGQPFYLDFNYTSKRPPTSYKWTKNGQEFREDGDRVVIDHTGIVFTRVMQEDAGQYKVVASNDAGTVEAQSVFSGT